MRNYVIINGVNSTTIQGLAINILPPITKPLIRTEIEEIDGRDGDLVTELGYSAYDKSMEIGLWGTYDIDAIIKYFTGEGTIIFSNEPDKYYNFKIINQIDYDKLLKFKKAVVTFHCQPFKYPVEETPIEGVATTVTGSGSNITLENTVVAPMKMKVKGNTIQNGTPTPSSPITVQNVSCNNTINVVGKNLFDNANAFLFGSNNIYVASSNDYNSRGTIKVQPSTSYRLSLTSGNITDGKAYFYDKDMVAISNTNAYSSFTTPSNAMYLSFYATSGNQFSGTEYAQLELGTQATTYTPYTSNSYDIDLGVENLADISVIPYVQNANITRLVYNNTIILSGNTNTAGYATTDRKLSQICPDLKVGDIATLSFNSTFNTNYIYITGYNSTWVNNTSKTITQSMLDGTVVVYGGYNQLTYITNFMINKGSTALPYEEYRSPIELCKIGTYQDKIDKSTGRNLFDKNELSAGYLNADGNPNGDSTYRTSDFIPIKQNTAYYKPSTVSPRTKYYDVNKQPLNTTTYQDVSIGGSAGTFTTPNDAYYFRFSFPIIGTNAVDINTLIFNEGTTALPYEPYGTGWYLKKEIGKVVLNGSEEGWNSGDVGTDARRFYKSFVVNDILGYTDTSRHGDRILCDYFNTTNVFDNIIGTMYQYQTQVFFNMKRADYPNTGAWTTWLSSNNITLYYVLETPTYTEITDTTLINQLEALKPYSYNPVTNITQTNNDAPFELDVSLSYTNTMNVNNVGNIYAKPILTIEGSGTIGIILNDIEVLSVDLGTDEKITIDVPNLQAYNPDNDVLLNRNVTGDYMKLLINDGDNTIAFSGSVTSATLTNYTRWI